MFSYIWAVIEGLIKINIILSIYSNIYGIFEIIVVSILILIYIESQWHFLDIMDAIIHFDKALGFEFRWINKLLKKEEVKENEDRQKFKEFLDKKMILVCIRGVILSVIVAIVLYNLLKTLSWF